MLRCRYYVVTQDGLFPMTNILHTSPAAGAGALRADMSEHFSFIMDEVRDRKVMVSHGCACSGDSCSA